MHINEVVSFLLIVGEALVLKEGDIYFKYRSFIVQMEMSPTIKISEYSKGFYHLCGK